MRRWFIKLFSCSIAARIRFQLAHDFVLNSSHSSALSKSARRLKTMSETCDASSVDEQAPRALASCPLLNSSLRYSFLHVAFETRVITLEIASSMWQLRWTGIENRPPNAKDQKWVGIPSIEAFSKIPSSGSGCSANLQVLQYIQTSSPSFVWLSLRSAPLV